MARPRASELTPRELEIMQVFWDEGQITAADVREKLAASGRDLAYTTVATLVKILLDKGFIEQQSEKRPFTYESVRSFDEVAGNLLTDMVKKVFGGSREQLLVRLIDQKKLTNREKSLLENILREQNK